MGICTVFHTNFSAKYCSQIFSLSRISSKLKPVLGQFELFALLYLCTVYASISIRVISFILQAIDCFFIIKRKIVKQKLIGNYPNGQSRLKQKQTSIFLEKCFLRLSFWILTYHIKIKERNTSLPCFTDFLIKHFSKSPTLVP